MVVQGLAGGLRPHRPPGPPVSAQHWVEFLEHFQFVFAKRNKLGIGELQETMLKRQYATVKLSVICNLQSATKITACWFRPQIPDYRKGPVALSGTAVISNTDYSSVI